MPKRRSTSDRPNIHLHRTEDETPSTSRRNENNDAFSFGGEARGVPPVQAAGSNTPNAAPSAPEWPSEDEEYSDGDEPFSVEVGENMDTYDAAAGHFEDGEWLGTCSPKKPRLLTADEIKRECETPEASPFAGGLDAFVNPLVSPLQTPDHTPPPPVPDLIPLQYNPERHPCTTGHGQQYAGPTHPRMAMGFPSSPMMVNNPPFLESQNLPSRIITAPTRSIASMLLEWNALRNLGFYRPWDNSSMGGGAQASMVPDAAPHDVAYPYRPPRSVTHSNVIRSAPGNISSYAETEIVMYGSLNHPSPNNTPHPHSRGTNDASFSLPVRLFSVPQSHLTSHPGTFTPESPQSGDSCHFARPSAGHLTGSNLGQFQRQLNPHLSSAQSTIRINYSASGRSVPAPMESSLPQGFPPNRQRPTPLSPMAQLLESINQMVDSITASMQQEGAYGFPPGPSGEN